VSTQIPSTPALGLLSGRRILVTGMLTPRSIAFAIAATAQAAGAEVMLTSFGRAMSLTQKSAKRLTPVPEVLEMDVTDVAQVQAVAEHARRIWGGVDGVVHAIGFAPADCLGGGFLEAPWSSVSTAFQVSSYSLQTLAAAFAPLMPESGGSIVTLTFDARVAWPVYDWMGPAKAALEAIVRYLARELGPRGIPGFEVLKSSWGRHAPLGWDSSDSGPVADVTAFLLSDLSRGITGEMIHVDGGYHSQGAPAIETAEAKV